MFVWFFRDDYILYSDRYINDMPISVNSESIKDGYSQEKYHSIGMRYNITETVDIKFQYDYKSSFKYRNNPLDQTIYSNIYTFAIDMMF